MISTLQQLIVERIQREGPITFADYMHMALYEPAHGYYVTGLAKMGWEGDYYTSTDVSPFFAYCMARQLSLIWQHLNSPQTFIVLEQGAGRGDLAQSIRNWAEQEAPQFFQALDYRVEDIKGGQNALQSTQTPSVILSNELIDAFPVHIIEKRDAQLYEVYVDEQHGTLHEVLSAPSSHEVASYLDGYKIPWRTFADGWRAEVNLDAIRWMEQAAKQLLASPPRKKRHAFLITLDYGDKALALYTQYRRRGTLACYFQHQFSERPLARPGEQDITAHVNFTALLNTGRRNGLHLQTFTTQREWLTTMGIYEELEKIRKRDFAILESARASDQGQSALLQWYNIRQRVSALTEPTGMGNFKVLILKS